MPLGREEFKPYMLYLLGERFSSLDNLLKQGRQGRQQSKEKQFEKFMRELGDVSEVTRTACLEKSTDWLNIQLKEIRTRKDEDEKSGRIYSFPTIEQWRKVTEDLRRQISAELHSFPAVLLSESSAPEDIEKTFDAGVFQYLPALAQRDFHEAAFCWRCGQHTAAAVLAWRAAEATLREYYFRRRRNEVSGQTWEGILNELRNDPGIDGNVLDEGKKRRNQFAHPLGRLEANEQGKVGDEINAARLVVSMLVASLKEQNLKNKVAARVSNWPDVVLALYILEKHDQGIGCLVYLDGDQYDLDDYNYVVGMADSEFNFRPLQSVSDCIAWRMARRFGVQEQYRWLIDYIFALEKHGGDSLALSSNHPAQTLGAMLVTIAERFKNEDYYVQARTLFSAIIEKHVENPQIDPFDPDFYYSFPEFNKIFHWTEKRWTEKQRRLDNENLAWKNCKEVIIGRLKIAVIASGHGALKEKAFDSNYGAVILTDSVDKIEVSWPKGNRGDPSPYQQLYRRLKQLPHINLTPMAGDGFTGTGGNVSIDQVMRVLESG